METSLTQASPLSLQTFKDRYAQQQNQDSFDSLSIEEQITGIEQIVLQMGEFSGRIVEMLTEALWEVYSKALWNAQLSFEEWADDISSGFDDSTKRQFRATAQGINRVFSLVYERENANQPMLDAANEPITVERLLKRASYVRNYSYQVSKSADPERWIRTIVEGTHSDLEVLKDQENYRPLVPIEVRKEGDCYRLELFLSEEQYAVVERLLRKVAKFPVLGV